MKRLHQLDLNLLLALDALLVEGTVTRAATRLGVSQPAVSQKLRRLREALEDPLFVAGPRGLVPTTRAMQMGPPLRRLLEDLADVVLGEDVFDPATAERTFVLAGADLFELAVLPSVLELAAERAPGIRLSVRPRPPDLVEHLERGSIDFAVGPVFVQGSGLRRVKLSEDGFVVVARPGHPLMSGRFTLAKYLRAKHVLVAPGGKPGSFVDSALAEAGHTRQISAQVASFVSAPFLVMKGDLLATLPAQLVDAVQAYLPLETRRLPLPVPDVASYLLWHERFERDPGHQWFRDTARAFSRRPPKRRGGSQTS